MFTWKKPEKEKTKNNDQELQAAIQKLDDVGQLCRSFSLLIQLSHKVASMLISPERNLNLLTNALR